MSLNELVAYKDKRRSAKIGKENAKIVVANVIKWLENKVLKIPEGTLTFDELPEYHPLDYVIWKNSLRKDIVMQIEVKVRGKFYPDSKIPTRKEIQAREDFRNYGIKSYYVAYYQDIKSLYIYDLLEEPIRRTVGEMGRPDRPNDIDDYSYYTKYIEIK